MLSYTVVNVLLTRETWFYMPECDFGHSKLKRIWGCPNLFSHQTFCFITYNIGKVSYGYIVYIIQFVRIVKNNVDDHVLIGTGLS